MSRDSQVLLQHVEQLSEEKPTFADDILRRLLPWDSFPLVDEEIGAVSDALPAAGPRCGPA